ncbi:ABC transporter permease [candidate division KSB1 bacterium]
MKKSKLIKPPKIAAWLLKRLSSNYNNTAVQGDLEEEFYMICEEKSLGKSKNWYRLQVVKSLPKIFKHKIYWSFTMFKNYLKTAFRNIKRQKGYSIINISGLALGIACCTLISAYIFNELSYDRYPENSDRIFRILVQGNFSGRDVNMAIVPALAAPALLNDFPEVSNSTGLFKSNQIMLSFEDKKFYESNVLYAYNSIFEMFSFKMINGDIKTALKAPFCIVLTEKTANKYFGNEDPIGKTLKLDDENEFLVTGVVEPPPSNSHFNFDILLSMETLRTTYPERLQRWANFDTFTYVLLREDSDLKEFESKLIQFKNEHFSDIINVVGDNFNLILQPLIKIHLYSNMSYELSVNGDIKHIYAFSIIAFIILLVACINYMNLSTARVSNRTREIGMRKVLGAERKQLMTQFFGETLLYSFFSLIAAVILVKIFLPYFNYLSGSQLDMSFLLSAKIIMGLVLITILTGIIAGSYPAVLLSGFQPVSILKSDSSKRKRRSSFRNTLVTFQFVISAVLIISTMIIYKQINFMKNTKLGFDKEQILVLSLDSITNVDRMNLLKDELLKISGVQNTSVSSAVPGEFISGTSFLPEGFPENTNLFMKFFHVDFDFIETFDIEMLHGRDFSKDISTDSRNGVLINETALKRIGWEDPVGRKIRYSVRPEEDMFIIGVVKDYHFKSLDNPVEPLLITNRPDYLSRLSLKLNTADISNTMTQIEKKWNEVLPVYPFKFFFINDSFNSLYKSYNQLGSIFQTFTILAIIIGSLGLFGLISFTAEQRKKEICIRKIVGATIPKILQLVLKEFLILIFIANIIAWPAAWYLMNKWIQDFAYKTDIGISIFFLAAFFSVTITLLTVGYQSIKAAKTNPVDTLRHE